MNHTRTLVVGFCAAIMGAVTVLLWQRFTHEQPQMPVPPPPAVASHEVVGPLSLQNMQPRILINPCLDLYTYVCSVKKSSDPTGAVKQDTEGEVEALRIYEGLIRKYPQKSIEDLDELLVKKIYTPERTKRIQDLFEKTRSRMLQFIDAQPAEVLRYVDKETLKTRINRVRLELPPPASTYDDEPDLFTRNDVYFERLANGEVRIRMGGALLLTVESKFNLAFTLAHELAHSIDPCELRNDKFDIPAYEPLIECLGTSHSLANDCSVNGKLAETFADWMATQMVADRLVEKKTTYTSTELRSALYNSVRDLCEDDDYIPQDAAQLGLASSHPNNAVRVNGIFSQHPRIRELLGCKDEAGPQLPGVASYCFWTVKNRVE